MIKMRYIISKFDLFWFAVYMILGAGIASILPSSIFKNELYSNTISVLSILVGFNATSMAVLYNSKILKTLYDKKDQVYGNALNRITSYAYSFIYFSLLAILFLLLFPPDLVLHSIEIKHYSVVMCLCGAISLFIKNLNYFFELFRFPRNE